MLDDRALMIGIQELDLNMIKLKLMDPDEGRGWDAELCELLLLEYRRFLALARRYPDRTVVPSRLLDQVWHAHILDTQNYALDCNRIFGYFLHHYPYLGMGQSASNDRQALLHAAEETLQLYRCHFGEPPPEVWSTATKCGAPAYAFAKCGAPGMAKCGAPGALVLASAADAAPGAPGAH